MATRKGSVSGPTGILLIGLGLTLMLVATGVIEVDPGQLRTAPAVLFGTGLLFLILGLLAIVEPRQTRYPQASQFLVALLASSAAVLVGSIAFYSHDERLAIGPFVFSGPAVDAFGKIVLGLDAILLAGVALWRWSVWSRAR